MRKQRIPQIKMPPMPANEKKMWRDYVKAREAKSPAAVKAWARKYKVKLKSGNRVEVSRSYRGAGAPAPQATAAPANCRDICHISHFERWEKLGNHRMVLSCDLDSCKYESDIKSWICYYTCLSGIRLK